MSDQKKILALLEIEVQATLLCSKQLSSLQQSLLADISDRTDDPYTIKIIALGNENESLYNGARKELLKHLRGIASDD